MDQAAIYIAQTASRYPPLSPIEEKKLIRRIDWILVPMVRINFLFTPELFLLSHNTIHIELAWTAPS